MNRVLTNENGVALVVTLAIVAILIAAALQLGKFTGDSVMITMVERDQFQAEQYAISGINLALILLSEDATKNTIDSVQEVWADDQMLSRAVSEMGLSDKQLSLTITDELSKIQVNALLMVFPGNAINPDQLKIWERFLQLRFSNDKSKDARDPAEVINSVKDWLDSLDEDAITGLSGAESEYYMGLEFPYDCGNGPFNHIDELTNVKGITTDFLFSEELEEKNDDTQEDEMILLSDVFTVYGIDSKEAENGGFRFSGKVNINTASSGVLSALLPEGMEDLAEDLVNFRSEKGGEGYVFVNSLDKGWYKKVIELSQNEQKQFDRIIRYDSNCFRIEVMGRHNGASVKLIAYVIRERDKASARWKCRIIQVERV